MLVCGGCECWYVGGDAGMWGGVGVLVCGGEGVSAGMWG